MNYAEIYKSYLSSRLKMKEFCEKEGVPFGSFRGYVIALKKKEKKNSLVPVKVIESVSKVQSEATNKVTCQLTCPNGFTLIFSELPHPKWLQELLGGKA